MNIILSPYHFQEIIKKGYSLDLIYIMLMVQNDTDISQMCEDSVKIASLHSTLIRKGLLTDHNKLTLTGVGVLAFLETKEEVKLSTKKKPSDDFDNWWKAFPGTDIFTHNGKSFTGCRSLKSKKEDCRSRLSTILNEGEYTIDQLIGALEFDVNSKKKQSVISNANKLTYMQNSLTYLNQRSFEPFIELLGTTQPESTNYGGTDI
jgi:hypothetical protein